MTKMWPILRLRGIEADTVVVDYELYPTIEAVERNVRLPRVRMPRDIPQCFLCNTKQAECRILRKREGNSARLELDSSRPEFREPLAFGFQRFAQAEIFKN